MSKFEMNIKASYVILVLYIIVSGCSSQAEPLTQDLINWENLQIAPRSINELCPEIFPQQLDLTGEAVKRDFSYGLAQALYPRDISNTYKISAGTYWVDSNKQLTVNWLFWYPKGNQGPIDLRLIILLDEQQLTKALPQQDKYQDLHLEKGDEIITIPITLPGLSPGVHTVIAIAIPSPQNAPDEYGSVEIISSRMTLIAEPTKDPFRAIDFFSLPAEGSIKNDDPLMAIELTFTSKEDRKSGIHIWNWPDPWFAVRTGVPVRFYALAGYEDVKNLDAPSLKPLEKSFFAMLLFVDYQQVEITPNQKVLYIVADKDNAYTRVPIEFTNLTEGRHYILALRIDTPGVPMCILRGDPTERILPNSIYGKLVGIEVLPP
jgi:hypothetical protein